MSTIAAAVPMSFGLWIHMLPLVRLLSTPPDTYVYLPSLPDKLGRPPAFWHTVWTIYRAQRCFVYIALWLFSLCYIVCMRRSARVVARVLCAVFGGMLLLNGVSDLTINVAISVSAGIPRAPWFFPAVAVQALLSVAIGAWMLLPSSRISAQVLFAKVGGRDVHSCPETALAAIIGYGSNLGECDPPALVDFALQTFEPVVLTVASLRQMGSALFASRDELQHARAHWRVGRRHTFALRSGWGWNKERVNPEASSSYVVMASADCYVVHSPEDDAIHKLDALCAWVGRFEAEHGRAPCVWLNSLCVDPSLSEIELLEHMPVYLARSERLLLLASTRGITHLRNAVECYVFRALGGPLSRMDVSIIGMAPVVRRSTQGIDDDVGISREYTSSVVSAFDTFHVMFTSTRGEVLHVRARLLRAVELVNVAYFNMIVRETVARVRAAVASPHMPVDGHSLIRHHH